VYDKIKKADENFGKYEKIVEVLSNLRKELLNGTLKIRGW